MNFYKEKQRFSLRKYNIGLASVMLGTAILGVAVNSEQAYADELPVEDTVVEVVQPEAEPTEEAISNDVVEPTVESIPETPVAEPVEDTTEFVEVSTFVEETPEEVVETNLVEDVSEDKVDITTLASELQDNESEEQPVTFSALLAQTRAAENSDDATTDNLKVTIDSPKTEYNKGETITSNVNLRLEGIDESIDEVTVVYEFVTDDNINGWQNKVSDVGQNKASGTNTKFTQKFNNIISGSDIIIPVIHSATLIHDNIPEVNYDLLVTVMDKNGRIIQQNTESFKVNQPVINPATLTIKETGKGYDDNGNPIVGSEKGGNIVSRYAVSYSVNPDEVNPTGIAQGFKYVIDFDSENWEVVQTRGSSANVQINPDNPNQILVDTYARPDNTDFTLLYKGDSTTPPDSNFTVKVANPTKPDVKNVTTDVNKLNHKNIIDKDPIPEGVIRITNSLKPSTESNNPGSSTGNSSTSIGSMMAYAKYNDNEKTYLRAETKIGTSSQTGAFLDKIQIEVPKQTDDKFQPSELTELRTWGDLTQDGDEVTVKFVGNNGSVLKTEKTTIKNGLIDLDYDVDISNVDYIEIDTGRKFVAKGAEQTYRLNYKTENTKVSDWLSDYNSTKELDNYNEILDNTFVYGARVNNSTETFKSNPAAFVAPLTIYSPSLQFAVNAKNTTINKSVSQVTSNSTGESGYVITDNDSWIVYAVEDGVEVNLTPKTLENLESSEPVVETRNGLNYYKYKLKEGLKLNASSDEFAQASFKVTEAALVREEDGQVVSKVYYGAILPNNGSSYITVKDDPIDIDNDGNIDESTAISDREYDFASRGDRVASTSMDTITIPVPKSLFIFDESSKDGNFNIITTGVKAGENADIKINVLNTTDTPYSNSTVITKLANIDATTADGSKPRKSDFTPTLAGKVTPPAGWTVQYTTEDVTSKAVEDITGWVSNPSDYSKVTALKFVSNDGTEIAAGKVIEFTYTLKTDPDANGGDKIRTTSAIAINGSNNFLEGYNSYVYIKQTYGDVIVRYEDEDGNVIKEEVVNKPDSTPTKTPYDTTKDRPETITFKNEQYDFVEIKKGSAPETGQVKEGTTIVTYVYSNGKEETVKETGSVTVKYVIEDTNTELKPQYKDTTDQLVNTIVKKVFKDGREQILSQTPSGAKYNTAENANEKPTELTKDGLTYVYSKTTGAPEADTLKKGSVEVVYHYAPKSGGKVEEIRVTDKGKVLVDKKVVQPDGTQVGTKYTSETIKELTDENGLVYTFKEVSKNTDPATGTVTESPKLVTHVYTAKPGGKVDELRITDTGITLVSRKTIVPDKTQVGTEYNSEIIQELSDKHGRIYRFTEISKDTDPATGTVAEKTKLVTHIYTAVDGNGVNKIFTDTEGNEIRTPELILPDGTQLNTAYSTDTPKEIVYNGTTYSFVKVDENSAPLTGRTTDKLQTVHLVYQPKIKDVNTKETTGTVIVEYITTTGEQILEPNTIISNAVLTTTTTTTYNDGTKDKVETKTNNVNYVATKQNTIIKDGFEYKLVKLDEKSAAERGSVKEGVTKVIYVYEPTPITSKDVKTGSVVVHYVTIDDNEKLADDVTAVNNAKVSEVITTKLPSGNTSETVPTNETYDVTGLGRKTITKDGFEYELVKSSENETGKVKEGTTDVTFYYKVKPQLEKVDYTGTVIVKYVDTKGNVIKEQVVPVKDEKVRTETITKLPSGSTTEETTTDYEYDVTKEFHETIEFDGDNYTHNSTIGELKDLLKEGETVITLVYDLVVTTSYIEVGGKELDPTVEGTEPPKEFDGYEFVETKVDDKGHTTHIYKPIEEKPAEPTEKPVEVAPMEAPKQEIPVVASQPVQTKPVETPAQPQPVQEVKELPSTGAETALGAFSALIGATSALGATKFKKKED